MAKSSFDSFDSNNPGPFEIKSVGDLLAHCQRLGVALSIGSDGRLAYDGPAGVVDDGLLAALKLRRDELLAVLRGRPVVVHCQRDPFDVYIGRPNQENPVAPWGNPFVIGGDGDRAQVIEKFRRWILKQPKLMARLPELRGKRLGCWCSPKACHGDVLADLVEPLPSLASVPGVICPWCRRGDLLRDKPGGIGCWRCNRLAFRFLADGSIERADI